MVSVALKHEEARQTIMGFEDRVGVAAINDLDSTVLSGDIDAVDTILARLAARGVQSRSLRVNYAFHSPQMEPFCVELEAALAVDADKDQSYVLAVLTAAGPTKTMAFAEEAV